MSFPNSQDKYGTPGVLTAAGLLASRDVDPSSLLRGAVSAVICFQEETLRSLVKGSGGSILRGLSGEAHSLGKRHPGLIAVKPGGVGAPPLALLLEELSVCGIRSVIAVGIAGSLDAASSAGTIMVPSSAIRDEGTSYHYRPEAFPAQPSADALRRLTDALRNRSVPFATGGVWTTDAVLRETAEEVRHYRTQGVLAVDMECSALFVVGSALGLECACGLVVSDSISGGVWRPARDDKAVQTSLSVLSACAVEALAR